MSSFSFEAQGLTELIKEFEELGSREEALIVNKKIVKECGGLVQANAKELAPISLDHMNSGRWNKSGHFRSQPPEHMANAIPLKVKGQTAIVGWEKSDTSPYFYAKFEEYGTSEHPPHPFLQPALENSEGEFNEIAEEKYAELINKKLGA